MQISLTIDSAAIDPALRDQALERLERWLLRFETRIGEVDAVLRDEHGRHGAPHYRCRLEAALEDGGRIRVSADHAHPQGALSGAAEAMRRRLAEVASGISKRRRRSARRRIAA